MNLALLLVGFCLMFVGLAMRSLAAAVFSAGAMCVLLALGLAAAQEKAAQRAPERVPPE